MCAISACLTHRVSIEINCGYLIPVKERYEKLLCGVAIVNIVSGERVGIFEFTSGCEEIFDIRFLDGIHKPPILNTERPEILEAVNAPEFSYWLRKENLVKDYT